MSTSSDEDSKLSYSSQNTQVTECIRQFQLPCQFPSKVTKHRSSNSRSEKSVTAMSKKNIKNFVSVSPTTGKIEIIQNIEDAASDNFKKFKFKLPDGQDLGGVIVVPTHGNKFEKIFSLPKIKSKTKKTYDSTITSSSSKHHRKDNLKSSTSLYSDSTPFQALCEKSGKFITLNTNLQTATVDVDDRDFSTSVTSHSLDDSDSSEEKILIQGSDSKIKKFMIQNSNISNKQNLIPVDIKKIGSQKVMFMKNSNINTNDFEKVIANIPGKISNVSILKKRSIPPADKIKIISNKKLCRDLSAQNSRNLLTKQNVMIVVPEEELTSSSYSHRSGEDFHKNINKINVVPNSTSRRFYQLDNDFETSSICSETSTICSEAPNTSDKLRILKKALLSVQDANLRAEAMEALKGCGIKVSKRVPVKRPSDKKIICESATQTDVFSLLKKEEFIQVTTEHEGLIKIQQNQKIFKKSLNAFVPNLSYNQTMSEPDRLEYEKNLDKMLAKNFPETENIFDDKEAAQNKINMMMKIILNNLKKDLDFVRNYDDDGFLGIHKAVINDDIREVQKQIMMLKAIKISIDITTQDEKTSLELAIEHEVNPQIIQILLDSGAKPVSSESMHDSALTLAAKKSSKILSLLLKYIDKSNRSLINTKNSEGLAAIHYCALLGNLEGITELMNHGANVNLKDDRSGRTALFYAVETKRDDVSQETYNEICHRLLEKGALASIPTFSKHSVLSMIDDVKSHALKIAINRAVE